MKGIPLNPFYFLRHGETDWNLERRAMGSQDIPLNDRGISQSLNAAELLKDEPIATLLPHLYSERARRQISLPLSSEITDVQEACWDDKGGWSE